MESVRTSGDGIGKGSYPPQNLSRAYDEFIKSISIASRKLATTLETSFTLSFGKNIGSEFCLAVEDASQKYVDDIDRLLKNYISKAGEASETVETSRTQKEAQSTDNASVLTAASSPDKIAYQDLFQNPTAQGQTTTSTTEHITTVQQNQNDVQDPIAAQVVEQPYVDVAEHSGENFMAEGNLVQDDTHTYYFFDGQTFQVSNGEIIFEEQGDLQHENVQYVTTSFPEGTVVVKCEDIEAELVESAIATETIISESGSVKDVSSVSGSMKDASSVSGKSAMKMQSMQSQQLTKTTLVNKEGLAKTNAEGMGRKAKLSFWTDGRKRGTTYFNNINADKEDLDFEYSIEPISRRKPKRKALLPGAKPGFTCEICGDILASKMALTRHINQAHPNIGKWKCLVCCKILPAWKKLRTHFRVKHMVGGKGFKCPECETVFRGHRRFKEHLIECPYTCPDDMEQSETEMVKNEMQDVGTVESAAPLPFRCSFCPRSFKSSGNLNNHVTKSHLKYTPGSTNSCDICEKRFTKPYYYARHCETATHRKNVREKYGIPDDEDSVDWPSTTATKVRKAKQTGKESGAESKDSKEKELNICHICGRSGFTTKSNLYIHIRTHTKPFQCDMCDKRFSEKMHARAHRRLHTGEAPFVCELCGKFFREKYLLNHHKSAFHSHRTFKCNDCQTLFKYKRSLCMHMQKKHGVEDFDIVYQNSEEVEAIELVGFY